MKDTDFQNPDKMPDSFQNTPAAQPESSPERTAEPLEKTSAIADTLQFILMIALIIATIAISRLPLYSVVGQSMEDTFFDGNVVVGDKHPDIRTGDILIINSDVLDERIIKRCIGLPGDTVEIKNNKMYLNGQELNEDYIKEPMDTEDLSVTLKEGEYFVAGDNRNHSTDSREIGNIPVASIEAKVTYNLTDKLGIDFKRLTIIRRGIVIASIAYIAYVFITSFIIEPLRKKKGEQKDC